MKQYLPIGSVVLLKNGKKKVMIYGRRQRRIVDVDKEYDYLACLYPEGNIDEDYMYLFDEDSIDQVVFRGYSDAEEDAFVQAMNEIE